MYLSVVELSFRERESAPEKAREKEMKCRQKFAWPQEKVHPTSARSASVDGIEISLAQMSRGPRIGSVPIRHIYHNGTVCFPTMTICTSASAINPPDCTPVIRTRRMSPPIPWR